MKLTPRHLLLSFLLLLSVFSPRSRAEAPAYLAECAPTNTTAQKMTLHFDSLEGSLLEPKEREPIWMNYNEDLGEFTYCQQKSQYVSLFLSSLVTLMQKPNFRKDSLASGKMKLDPLSAPFVCVKFSKKGYEYVGAFVFDHENNRFPSPNDNKYGMIFLSLEGKAKDANLGKPTIVVSTDSTRAISALRGKTLDEHAARLHGKTKGARPTRIAKKVVVRRPTLPLFAKTRAFVCRSMGSGGTLEDRPPPSLEDDFPMQMPAGEEEEGISPAELAE